MQTKKRLTLSLLLALALSACATPEPRPCQPSEVSPPKLPPAPADVMVKREANFLARLQQFFSSKKPEDRMK